MNILNILNILNIGYRESIIGYWVIGILGLLGVGIAVVADARYGRSRRAFSHDNEKEKERNGGWGMGN